MQRWPASVRIILVSVRGKYFSVGGDLGVFLTRSSDAEPVVRSIAAALHRGVRALARAAAPVVLALGGMAAGGAFSIVCGADCVIAMASARLNSDYAKTGLTPDGGGSWFLPRRVGLQRAFDILATCPTLTAVEAHEIGIVARAAGRSLRWRG
jgi:2-(1,2-epoxy-1,2-dihydrophenyl)acetyl-CoA isomerase